MSCCTWPRLEQALFPLFACLSHPPLSEESFAVLPLSSLHVCIAPWMYQWSVVPCRMLCIQCNYIIFLNEKNVCFLVKIWEGHTWMLADRQWSYLNHTRSPKIMDKSYKIFDFLHSHCLICTRSPKILDRSYMIFDFLHSHCLIHTRLPKIMDRSYMIFHLLHSNYITLAIW